MTYEEFKMIVSKTLSEKIPPSEKFEGCEFRMVSMPDGREGLCIANMNNIPVPLMQLQPYFEKFGETNNLFQIINEIANDYYDKVKWGISHDFNKYLSLPYIMKNLYFKAVNYEENAKWLQKQEIPYKKRMDLALIPKVQIPEASFVVTHKLREALGMSTVELLEQTTRNNSKCLPIKIENICEFVKERGIQVPEEGHVEVYILRNEIDFESASLMFETDILDAMKERLGEKMVIVPCSVHEVMLMGYDDYPSLNDHRSMVEHVNKNFLNEGEFLSNNVYVYDSSKKKYYMYDGIGLKPEKLQERDRGKSK